MKMNLCRPLHPLTQGNRPGEMRDSITQGDRWMVALELASEFLPERKWCRELSKESCEVFDMSTRVVLWNNDACWRSYEGYLEELLGEVPDSLKLLEDQEETKNYLGNRWRRHTTTYEFELSVAGGHRVWLRKLLISGYYEKWGIPMWGHSGAIRTHFNVGYYQVGVPISLFRQLRSTGCFKEHLLHCQMKDEDVDLLEPHRFQMRLRTVLNYFENGVW